ncbi:MAG: hypothetical protein GTN49_07840 [candidate division Zixibacteria bacterium]|nr:hypothetical protein [candidate division Zixibacteria bacterium]
MKVRVYPWVLVSLAVLVFAAAPQAADVDTYVIAQLACPLKVTKLVAVYGPVGAKYKATDYVNINPEGTEKLWVFAVFENAGDDPITSFIADVLVWNAAGDELFRGEGEFEFPLRDNARSKEWGWAFEDAYAAAAVIFIPRVINFPASREWEADEKFIELKLGELRQAD